MSKSPVHYSIPIAGWAAPALDAAGTGSLATIDPLMRRRLGTLSRSTLAVALACLHDRPAVRVVFSSRHGELCRTTEVLQALCGTTPVSPTAFSLSVLNAMTGVLGIVRGDRSAATAISAGPRSLGFALLEACAQHVSDPASPVLVVHGDEPVPSVYGPVDDDIHAPEALALLIDNDKRVGWLDCATQTQTTETFATQAEALQHVLSSKQPAACNGQEWHWRWSDAAH